MKKLGSILALVVLGTVIFVSCPNTANTDSPINTENNEDNGNSGDSGNGENNGNSENQNQNQNQTVDLSTLLSSLTEDETATLEESINTQILSSANGLTGITASIDADKKLTLTYGESAKVTVTPPLTADGAIKLLEAYADKNTVIAAKKTELKNTTDNFTLPNGLAQKLEGNAADLKVSVKLLIENIPAEKFAYDFGNRAIYFKISDLDSSKLPAVSTQTPDAEIIPGVKRILRNNRSAIDFTGSNADIKIDCSPKEEETSINISDYYKGGILYTSNETVSLINDNGNFVCRINKEDFKNTDNKKSVLMDIIKAGNTNFSQLTIRSSDNNLYGIINDFYNNYGNKIIPFGSYDTREDVLKDASQETGYKRMFGDDNKLNPDLESNTDITMDVSLASYLMNKGITLKNVVITDENNTGWTMEPKSSSTTQLINSVVQADMSAVSTIRVKGLVRFEKKSPKTLSGNEYSKVIFKDEDTWNDELVASGKSTSNYPFLDISSLLNKQEEIATKLGFVYLSEDKVNTVNNSLAASLLFGEKYYKRGNYDYDNASRETYGNDGTIPTTVRNRTKVEDGTTVPLSHANNIKLTPMQRLLLDNQNTIG